MLFQADDRWYVATGSGERVAYVVAGVAWVLSFVSSPAAGPVPGLSTGLFVVFAWAMALLSARRLCIGALPGSRLFWLLIFAWGGLGGVAVSGGQWLDAAIICLAAVVFLFGAVSRDLRWLEVLFASIVCAGVIGAILGVLQVLWPQSVDGLTWLASNRATPGRAVGNLGQPNLLSTLLNLALIALLAVRVVSGNVFIFAVLILSAGVALTGSRTGIISLLIVLFFGLRFLPKGVGRRVWVGGIVLGFASALALSWMASLNGQSTFFFAQRVAGGSDFSSSRFSIWQDCVELLEDNIWSGVGWRMLNQAWTMAPMPNRSIALLDHAHNLSLQLAIELGVPVAVLYTALLGGALWAFLSKCRVFASQKQGIATFYPHIIISVCLLVLHSQLEYPLWYAFFLLPFSYWLGVLVRANVEQSSEAEMVPSIVLSKGLQLVGVLAIISCVFVFWDYGKVARVYAPSKNSESIPLGWRIDDARKSILFGHYGDLALIFTSDPRLVPLDVFERPLRNLINPRLLRDYALSLDAHSRPREAADAAARLREFHSPVAKEFFSVCAAGKNASKAFQCQMRESD